jgi:hypothetical protein
MQKSKLVKVCFIGLMFVGLVTLGSMPSMAEVTQRSIEEFVSAQGTHCIPVIPGDPNSGCLLSAPPLPNLLTWVDETTGQCALIDYAGLANEYLKSQSGGKIDLGTTFSGSVKERVLNNGGALLDIHIVTTNGLSWASTACLPAFQPMTFGYRVDEVLTGATPSLGDSILGVQIYVVGPGLPMPDIMRILDHPVIG